MDQLMKVTRLELKRVSQENASSRPVCLYISLIHDSGRTKKLTE